MKAASALRSVLTAGVAITSIGLPAVPAFASAQTVRIPAGTPFDLGSSPVGLPASCAFPNADANFVFGSGSGVFYGTENSNGDWGGETLQGPAGFYEDATPIAQGHLTIWFGGGNNGRGQSEGALTVNYSGTGPGGSVEIHVNGQMTVNAQGRPTAQVLNVHVACG